MNNLFPAFLNIANKKCLVIGGGKVAERKVKLLLQSQALISIVSPNLTSSLADLVAEDQVIYVKRKLKVADLSEMFLVVSTTGDIEVNGLLERESLKGRFLLNIADEPEKGNFFVPAVVTRGKLQIAISTAGASPFLARKIKVQLSQQYGPEYEEFVELLAQVRLKVLKSVADPEERRRIFQALSESELPELLKLGDDAKVKERISQCIS